MKTLFKVLALVLVATLAFSMISCGETHFSEEYVLEETDDIVRKIKNHSFVHVARDLPGMTDEEFAPVENAIHVAIHDGDYTIIHNSTESFTDDDENLVYKVIYTITSGANSVKVEVTYVDTHDALYRIDLIAE
ncbi:MAG: hypothetical protein IJY41_03890 [Clostridia bacterium]|nr:hypothetical protein [Clostridia bacterium]